MNFFRNKKILAFIFSLSQNLSFCENFQTSFFIPKVNISTTKAPKLKGSCVDFNFYKASIKGSFNTFADAVPTFSNFGLIDFSKFAHESILTDKDDLNSSAYEAAFGASSKTEALRTSIKSKTEENIKQNFGVSGNAEIFEVSLSAKKFFESGLFIKAEIPFKMTSVDKINFVPQAGASREVLEILEKDFDEVLEENGLEPFSQGFSANGASDSTFGFGWAVSENFDSKFVKSISCESDIGFILPFSTISQPEKEHLFYLPIGFYGHFGSYAHCNLEIQMQPGITFGGDLLANAFFPKNHFMRLKHSDLDFLYFLQKKEARVDLGSLWSASAYIKGGIEPLGLNLVFGYSYQSQEKTSLRIRQEVLERELGFFDGKKVEKINNLFSTPVVAGESLDVLEKDLRLRQTFNKVNDELVNKDPNLSRWYFHVAHIAIMVKPPLENSGFDSPCFCFSYNYPIYGKSAMVSKTFGGNFGFSFQLSF